MDEKDKKGGLLKRLNNVEGKNEEQLKETGYQGERQFYFILLNLTADLVIHTGIPTKEAKPEMETHPVTVETKISNCSI